jgi:excisionase family DNA binding protein
VSSSSKNELDEKGQDMKLWYTVEELAAELKVCRETIRRRIREGVILSKQMGRYHRIPAAEVKKFCSVCSDE